MNTNARLTLSNAIKPANGPTVVIANPAVAARLGEIAAPRPQRLTKKNYLAVVSDNFNVLADGKYTMTPSSRPGIVTITDQKFVWSLRVNLDDSSRRPTLAFHHILDTWVASADRRRRVDLVIDVIAFTCGTRLPVAATLPPEFAK